MKALIEKNLNAVLLISVIIGLTLPGVESIPSIVVSVLLAIMVFFLCAKITVAEIQGIAVTEVIVFYVLRFICLPILLFYLANAVVPRYATGVLLVALVPVGITTPTLVATFKGNVTLAFVLTIASSLLAPFVIPLIFMFIGTSSELKISGLFATLFSIVFIPMLTYFFLLYVRKKSKKFIESNSSFISVTLMGAVVAIVVSKQKDVFLTDFGSLFLVLTLLSIAFLVFYLFGWFYPKKQVDKRRLFFGLNLLNATFAAQEDWLVTDHHLDRVAHSTERFIHDGANLLASNQCCIRPGGGSYRNFGAACCVLGRIRLHGIHASGTADEDLLPIDVDGNGVAHAS